MTLEDRIHFMQSMMSVCMTNIMGDLSPEERKTLAEQMMSNMVAGFSKQAQGKSQEDSQEDSNE